MCSECIASDSEIYGFAPCNRVMAGFRKDGSVVKSVFVGTTGREMISFLSYASVVGDTLVSPCRVCLMSCVRLVEEPSCFIRLSSDRRQPRYSNPLISFQ